MSSNITMVYGTTRCGVNYSVVVRYSVTCRGICTWEISDGPAKGRVRGDVTDQPVTLEQKRALRHEIEDRIDRDLGLIPYPWEELAVMYQGRIAARRRELNLL